MKNVSKETIMQEIVEPIKEDILFFTERMFYPEKFYREEEVQKIRRRANPGYDLGVINAMKMDLSRISRTFDLKLRWIEIGDEIANKHGAERKKKEENEDE